MAKEKTNKTIDFEFKPNLRFDYNKWKKGLKKLFQSTMWGAGGKGVMLLNLLNIKSKDMKFIIDSNPYLENKFIPGTDIEILGSKEGLKKDNSNRIAVINPLYLKEIRKRVGEYSTEKKVFSVFPKL